jgi:chromosome segregation ATPase
LDCNYTKCGFFLEQEKLREQLKASEQARQQHRENLTDLIRDSKVMTGQITQLKSGIRDAGRQLLEKQNRIAQLEADNQAYKNNLERVQNHLKHKVAECAANLKVAEKLWDLLDNIDTTDDIAKTDEKLYRDIVRQTHLKRLQYAKSLDGYELTWEHNPSMSAYLLLAVNVAEAAKEVINYEEHGGVLTSDKIKLRDALAKYEEQRGERG